MGPVLVEKVDDHRLSAPVFRTFFSSKSLVTSDPVARSWESIVDISAASPATRTKPPSHSPPTSIIMVGRILSEPALSKSG